MKRSRALISSCAASCILAAAGAAAHAQYFQTQFATKDNERPRGVALCENGDLITTGYRAQGAAARAYASRHRSDGSLLWAWDYPESNPSAGWSTVELFNGDLVLAGATTSAGADLRLSLVRLDSSGAVDWAGAYASASFTLDDVFAGVRENVAVQPVLDIGLAVVATEPRPGFEGFTQAIMKLVDLNGAPIFQKDYITSISFPPVGISFSDLRLDTVSPNFGLIVTGSVVIEPLPGVGGPATVEALVARFDLAGNPISALSYRLVNSENESVDTYGDGIELLANGDVIVMGRTSYYGDSPEQAAVLRINPAGAVVWSRAVSGIAPAAAAMSRADDRTVSTAGYASPAAGEPGAIGLLTMGELGDHIFSRAFSQPSGPAESLGRDQVWVGGDFPGWAIAGDEAPPHTIGDRDIHLARTDDVGRSGCFERNVPAMVASPLAQVRQLSLLQSNETQWTYRDFNAVDPNFQQSTLCAGHCPCPGDTNGDSVVDFSDMDAVLANWGAVYTPGSGPGDADCSGVVDFEDMNAVLGSWGATCP